MAFLARKPAVAALTSLVLCAAGCVLAGRAKPRFAFSHAEHVGEQSLACVSCHADAGRSDEPGMPDADACSVCHDEIDATKPKALHVAQLFDGASYRAAHALALDAEVKFSHARHAAVISDCGACHADVATSAGETAGAFMMDRCTTCHDDRNVSPDCAVCHTRVGIDTAPLSHAVDWKRGHGRCVRSGSDATADRCALCHQESSCIQCHREEAPANHTAHWLQRGHGVTARMDRQNCAACHREESCASCHAEETPRNHTAAFGSPKNTHCVSCHFPLQATGCVTCHRDTRSHALAPPKPRDPIHVRGQNCRQCHVPPRTLEHVDNGSDCNACHH